MAGAGAGAGAGYQSISGRPGSGSGSSSNSGFQFLNFPFGDTTYTKVFVGGLAWETQSETLHRHFEQFGGEILEAVVITDKNTGRSKGYGFVTFRDPEAAKRACTDPSPVIDGRRANCNLASLGRPHPIPTYGRLSAVTPYYGGLQSPRGAYVGNPTYHQPVSYNYQHGFPYSSPHGYTAYGPEYVYPQGGYGPYVGQHHLQLYGIPGPVNSPIYPLGQFRQHLHGSHGYTAVQGYTMPSHHIMQFSGHDVNGVATARIPTVQAPYPTGFESSRASCHLCILEVVHRHDHQDTTKSDIESLQILEPEPETGKSTYCSSVGCCSVRKADALPMHAMTGGDIMYRWDAGSWFPANHL